MKRGTLHHGSFNQTIDAISAERFTKTILALDLDYRRNVTNLVRDAKVLLAKVSDYVCAVKLNFHLILPLSLSEIASLNDKINGEGLVSIADIKLNDIGNTNVITTRYLWNCGFSGVIVNPFVGYKGALDAVYEDAAKKHKGVISLAYMSHEGADEGFGLKLQSGRTIFDEFLKRAIDWKSSGVIMGTTRPEKISIAREYLGSDIRIICPGSGAQGGDAAAALSAGADYLIVGRAITKSRNPANSAKQCRLIAPTTAR